MAERGIQNSDPRCAPVGNGFRLKGKTREGVQRSVGVRQVGALALARNDTMRGSCPARLGSLAFVESRKASHILREEG